MKITKLDNTYAPNFKGALNNKLVLSGLEKISDHSATFSALTSFTMALFVRPLAINLTPDVEKENKQYATANSICSGVSKFLMTEAIVYPLENALKNIDSAPYKFLKLDTLKNFKGMTGEIIKSREYKFVSQILKQTAAFSAAIPKSVITAALIPIIMDKLFGKNKVNEETQSADDKQKSDGAGVSFGAARISNIMPDAISNTFGKTKNKVLNKLSSGVSKIIDNKKLQNFANKYVSHDKDIVKNMSAFTDITLTSAFALQTSRNKNIEEKRKKPLILNNTIATALSLVSGFWIDNIVKKQTEKAIKKFALENAGNKKLNKYIDGINVLRPTLIFAAVYYGILPVFSTYLSQKIDQLTSKENA